MLPLTPARALGASDVALGPLRADVTDYGPGKIWLPPAGKRKRGPITPEDQAQGVVPIPELGAGGLTSRTWPFYGLVSVGQRVTILVSSAFAGPALIQHFRFMARAPGGVIGRTALYWSEDGSGGINDSLGLEVPSGTPLFDSISTFGALDVDEVAQGYANANDGSATVDHPDIFLNYIVPVDGQFFLKVRLRAGAGETAGTKGHVQLVQGPSVAALAALL